MLLEVKHLKKSYDTGAILTDVNCEINKGDVIAVIGPSGCGKSTFINCLNRLIEPSDGQILFEGKEITNNSDLPKLRMKMGMVFQSFNLFANMTVLENVMLGAIELLKMDKKTAYYEAMNLLDTVGLASKADRYPFELSGGQQQRVAIARSLAMKPEILLLDEPTSALDPTMVGDVELVIKRLAKSGLTMIIVTHEMRFAKAIANRVFYMDEGIIYEQGTPYDIFDNPKKHKTMWFVSRMKVFSETIDLKTYDPYGFRERLTAFAKTQMISSKTLYKVELILDEYIIPRLTDKPMSFSLAYKDESDCAEISLGFLDNKTDMSLDAMDEIARKMFLFAIKDDSFKINSNEGTTTITMTVGGVQ